MSKKITTSLLLVSILFAGCNLDQQIDEIDKLPSDLDTQIPVFGTPNTKSIGENSTEVLIATVNNTSEITFDISAGADANKFSIDSTTGTLSFKVAPDFENPTDKNRDNDYEVEIKATDNKANEITKTITVTVTDIADIAPTLKSSSFQSAENISIGNKIGNIIIANSGDSTIKSIILSGDANEDFLLNTKGEITLVNALSYNTKPNYNLKAIAKNDAGYSQEITISITVLEPDTTKPVFTNTSTKSITENSISILLVSATDESTVTYSISSGNDSDKFSIDSNSGELLFKNAPDFENPTDINTDNIYEVTVKATDSSSNEANQTITVTVTDVADIVPTIEGFTKDVKENIAIGSTIGTIPINSSGDSTISSIVLSGDASLDFAINAQGEITVVNKLLFATKPTYNLTAIATNSAGDSSSVTVIINVLEVKDVIPATGQIDSKVDFDDGYYKKGLERGYTKDVETGIITDLATQLQWQDVTHSDGVNAYINYDIATSYCQSSAQGAFDDWRVPTMKELTYLIDRGDVNTFANTFENVSAWFYWSSTQNISDQTQNWGIDFTNGENARKSKVAAGFVKCVRGTPQADSNFTRDDTLSIVTDNSTNLIWQDTIEVKQNTKTRSFQDAITYCNGLEIDTLTNWRLPNYNELYSIVDISKDPAIDTSFINAAAKYTQDYYWSSTSDIHQNVPYAWKISFKNSQDYSQYTANGNKNYVRCVHSVE